MPLGKIAAQCAHALNVAIISRLNASFNDSEIILTPSAEFRNILNNLDRSCIELVYGNIDELNAFAESPSAFIEDNGLTVFGKPTVTVSWATEGWGDEVPVKHRLPFKTGTLAFKQPFFVYRSNSFNTPEVVIKNVAIASSLSLISKEINESLILKKDSAYALWLQNSFGKTVVGCKKIKNYKEATLNVINNVESQNIEIFEGGEPSVFVTSPLRSDVIEKFTRTKHTQLLK